MRVPFRRVLCRSSNRANLYTLTNFSDPELDQFQVGILGDLHLHPEQTKLFDGAVEHFRSVFVNGEVPLDGARLLQLGDLGSGKVASGSRSCFELANKYLSGFEVPKALITGNHDLEGEEFDTDEENLAAWREVFQQPHSWTAQLGPLLVIGLSTTRYRENAYSHHEVYISEEQREWLEDVLQQHPNMPVAIASHAPPIGCGLKVLEEIHVKNRCAWLNHSDDPSWFIRLVNKYPQIKLWFSGHFHLSHNYPDSISLVGGTAFVQTGVIGACSRDGCRQSRLLRGNHEGFELFTLDHESATLRLDLKGDWSPAHVPVVHTPEDELLCDPSKGWLCSQWDCSLGQDGYGVKWYVAGPNTLLALQDGLLVEYDLAMQAPIGVVAKGMSDDSELELLRSDGSPAVASDGSDVEVLRLVDPRAGTTEDFTRNEAGGFYQIFQPNKWRLKRERELEAQQQQQLMPAA